MSQPLPTVPPSDGGIDGCGAVEGTIDVSTKGVLLSRRIVILSLDILRQIGSTSTSGIGGCLVAQQGCELRHRQRRLLVKQRKIHLLVRHSSWQTLNPACAL